jgi:hypothetical protein
MALVVLHPNNTNYRRYKLNRLEDEIEEMMECRRRAVKEGLGRHVVFTSHLSSEEDHSLAAAGGAAVSKEKDKKTKKKEDPKKNKTLDAGCKAKDSSGTLALLAD